MEYRRFGSLDFAVSALGFGCMRLPTLGKPEQVDESAAIQLIRWAIDRGVNYVDTAYPYHGGNSERLLAKALADGYRKRVALADKMPVWLVAGPSDLDRLFQEQLERLQTDRIDFYLLHSLAAASWAKMKEIGALGWLERQRERGLIGHIGFSFHDSFEVFRQVIDEYPGWQFCQIQYNFVGEEVQAGTRGLDYAADKGLGVVIMEPLFGGTLANPPEAVWRVWETHSPCPSPAEMALRWLWHHPQVSTVLSGMGTMPQVEENVHAAARYGNATMTEAELHLIDRVRDAYKGLNPIPCTRCGYCSPCPQGVAIMDSFDLYNQAAAFAGNAVPLAKALYGMIPESARPDRCGKCGDCEDRCPQHLPIRDWLDKAHATLKGS